MGHGTEEDNEVRVLTTISEVLSLLDLNARKRILKWAQDKYSNEDLSKIAIPEQEHKTLIKNCNEILCNYNRNLTELQQECSRQTIGLKDGRCINNTTINKG